MTFMFTINMQLFAATLEGEIIHSAVFCRGPTDVRAHTGGVGV